jgi:hypothetical protein
VVTNGRYGQNRVPHGLGLDETAPLRYRNRRARVVELVDAADSKSAAERLVGSSPTSGTISTNQSMDWFPFFLNGFRHLYVNARFLFPLNCDRRVSRLWLFPKVKIFVA